MLRRTFLALTAAALAAQESDTRSAKLGQLAYIHHGALWIKSLPDGTPRILATGNRLYEPKFSPSGQWIMFQSGDDLLSLVSADGNGTKSWPAEASQWLPGDRLAVLLNEHTLIFAADDDWNSPRIALPGPIGAVSPDGSQRVWVSRSDTGTRLLAGPFDRPTEAKLIAETKEGGFKVFAFARGASRFLYWATDEDGADVWAYPLDIYMAGGAHAVNTGASSIMGDYSRMNMVSLSPTADTLAIATGGDNLTNYEKSIALLDLSSDSSQPLRTITGPKFAAIYPAFSPDGRQLAWCQGPDKDVLYKQLPAGTLSEVADERSTRERRIWLAGNGGFGEPKQLTDDPRYLDELPIWSQNGKQILFVRTDAQDATTLWLMRDDGSDLREVASAADKDNPILNLSDWFDWSFRFS